MNYTWGVLGPGRIESVRRVRTLQLVATTRDFNERAVPGLGGVWFGRQLFLATLGLRVAERAMYLSGRQLSLPDWESLDESSLAIAAAISFGLLRFYLLALKAASVVLLRLGRIEESRARLHVLAAVDSRDQLGASKLLEVIATFENPDESDLSLVAA